MLSANYSEPLWKGAHLQFNYELRYNQNKSDRQTYDFSHHVPNIFSNIVPEYREWDAWLNPVYTTMDDYFDKELSRYSEYKNFTHNMRLTLRHWQEKYDYNVGFLVQPQHSNFIQDYRGIYVDTIRNVVNFTPTIDFHYKFSDQHDIWLHYRGDTRQPDITQLLDITDDSNPLYITQGNPGLKPQFTAQRQADARKNTTRTTNVSQRLNLSYRNDWLEVTIDGNVNYQHSRNELQPSANLDTWRFSYGGQLMLRLPMGFEFSTNLHENSRRGYNDPSSNTNELIWNGQLSKSFLKSKTLTVALNFYDLLRQQSNYERWVNATGRSDTRYNSINSYAMLHVRYRLNMFGGKVDTEGRYNKKWGNRDRR